MNEMLRSTAPSQTIEAENDVNVRRIVVAVDLLEHSKKTALYAIALAKGLGASITFVHVFPRETMTEFAKEDFHRRYEQERNTAKERLARFGDELREIYPSCEIDFQIGDTAEQVHLVAFSDKANLIITSSYHPSVLGRLLGLEQATRIATRPPCPVLVVHQPEETQLTNRCVGVGSAAFQGSRSASAEND
jgi:nucleotide-binding universal stress UspA family protein